MTSTRKRTISLLCLRSEAVLSPDGARVLKPMLVGFAKASDLSEIAKAPSFGENDPNRALAEMLQKPPAQKWQRPLDGDRILQMAGFFNRGNLMPNPVLLAANPNLPQALKREIEGDVVKIDVDLDRRVKAEGALWILDGQHRIAALASAPSQGTNPVPFVLLLDEEGNYSSAEFAAIFAQVTTKAKPLEQPHHTWLEYSFKLGPYESPKGDARSRAFEAVVWLGSDELVPDTKTKNHFAGNIRFNPRYPDKTSKVGVEGLEGVFAFPAQDFAKLAYEHYYKKPKGAPLSPREVASELALAYDALKKVIPKSQSDAVFFRAGNSYIHEAFIVGCLTFLRIHGKPEQWETVLRRLRFDRGSWELRGRQINTGGQHGRASRAAATGAFQYAFANYDLPASAPTFVSFMLGDTAADVHISVVESLTGKKLHCEDISNQGTLPLDDVVKQGRSLRIGKDPNIGMLRITGETRAPGYYADMTRLAQTAAGFPLDDIANEIETLKDGAVTITIWGELYGGVPRSTKLIFT